MAADKAELQEVKNRATRRREAHARRREGKRGKFKRVEKAQMIEQIKANVGQWEQTREFHELNIDKNELLIDTLPTDADDYEERLSVLERSIEDEERQIHEIDVAIGNAENRIKELSSA